MHPQARCTKKEAPPKGLPATKFQSGHSLAIRRVHDQFHQGNIFAAGISQLPVAFISKVAVLRVHMPL